MNIRINDYGAIKGANLSLAQVSLICAPNAHGKTSIAEAVMQTATGEPVLADDIAKKDAQMLVHSGAKSGGCVIEDDKGGWARTVWPACEHDTGGSYSHTSLYASGARSFVDMQPKERAKLLDQWYGTGEISPNYFVSAVKEHLSSLDLQVPDDSIRDIWNRVAHSSFDAVYAEYREMIARKKGEWEAVSGERYGVRKADGWEPAGWSPALAKSNKQALDKAVAAAEKDYERAIAGAAVNEDEMERLRKEAVETKKLKKQADDIFKDVNALDNELYDLQKALNGYAHMPLPGQVCPHCSKPLKLLNGKIEARKEEETERKRPSEKKLEEMRKELDDKKKKLHDLQIALKTKEASYHAAVSAEKRLAELESQAEKASSGEVVSTDEAKSVLDATRASREAFERYHHAKLIHGTILTYQAIADVLAPDGLRRDKLGDVLINVNKTLEGLREIAGYDQVLLHEDMSITYGGYPYSRISRSQKYRVRALFQVMFAAAENDCPVITVFDDAEQLDNFGRVGLLQLLKSKGMKHAHSIVCMVMSGRDDIKRGLVDYLDGAVYWIERGEAVAVTREQSAA